MKTANDSRSTQSANAHSPSEVPPPFQPEKHEISVHELKRKLDQGEPVQLIDVREPMEHQIVCLEEARLIPINDLPQHIEQLDPSREIILHCHHGMRSMQAAYYLYQNGFQNVKSLTGGIEQWAIEIDPTLNRY